MNSLGKQAEVFYSFLIFFALANDFLLTPAVTDGGKTTVVERLVGQQQTDEKQSESNGVQREVQSEVVADSCENRYNMQKRQVFS